MSDKVENSKNMRVVIKCGGSILNNQAELTHIIAGIKSLIEKGYQPLIVHGGGPEISQLANKLGIKSEFKNGLRVTDAAMLEITQMALLGITNPKLVAELNKQTIKASGLALHTLGALIAETLDIATYGYVGVVTSVNPEPIYQLLANGFIPVIAPLAVDENWQILNINADLAAAAIAKAISAEKLILLSDIDGYYSNYPDPSSLVAELSLTELQHLLTTDNNSISAGMIPKLEACYQAVGSKVNTAHIINGNKAAALANIALGIAQIGTTIYKSSSNNTAIDKSTLQTKGASA
ncbi:acetylglutamate kinase [Aquella oligotrophica]|uniref:Acetylglutamate kinase n=1 Tax=Aquella oligotrophica TaxID=2067065 RepID=A0A2I7N494_9NEIS|nr:acetylglutamate kinase [Aquella oligotrophica]AUR51273.1 acetylglutamate kinase [Aquella oligotrophica]